MSSTKSRTRPSATQMIDATSTSPLISNIATTLNSSSTNALQQQYVPSLLKIESVVPTRINASTRNLQQRANRLITRSYSTLCGPTSIITPFTNGLVNYKNVTKKINTNLHHGHKNININGNHQNYYNQQQQQNERHESPTSKINGQQVSDTTNVIVENGVYKVRRTTKERDKHPDRINLDRRGLCTIPVIDNEPNLRLLSLQHNLINTFHIPDCEVSLESPADGVKDNNNNVPSNIDNIEKSPSAGNQSLVGSSSSNSLINKSTVITTATATTAATTAIKPLLRQKSRNQLNLNFSANNNTYNNATTAAAVAIGGNINNGSVGVGGVKMNGTTTSFFQKSLMFQGKHNSILKRANSVMINYSPAQTPPLGVSPITATTMQTSIFGTVQRGKLMATPSFSMIDTNMHHEMVNKYENGNKSATPELQIDANNSYMNSFRFNLTNLVFLDLYNNQIEKISNLDGLKSLTVLLLGKNRISDITGITSLKQTLRVLDLHGNRITHIAQKICQLQELKSLNLAGNLLRQIQANDFAGLCCLKELNLKRNRIKKINVSDDLHNLER